MKQLLYILTLIGVLISCQTATFTAEKDENMPVYKEQFLNWHNIYPDSWKNTSFPIWFSEELVKAEQIKTTKISFLNFYAPDSNFVTSDSTAYKSIKAEFKEDGSVQRLILSDYNEGFKISESIITYKNRIDSLGYSLPTIKNEVKFGKNENKEELPYLQLSLVESNAKYVLFQDLTGNQKTSHYYLLNEDNWNIPYIEFNFKPKGEAVFHYGSPKRFTDAFTLMNMVEKSMQIKQVFYSNGVLKQQDFYGKDFMTSRYLEYDEQGNCIGFSDSLKTISSDFIHLEKAVVNYDGELPVEINYFNAEDSLKLTQIKRIRFEYER